MADRPDFTRMKPEVAIPLIAEVCYDLRDYLKGNGQPGICQVRGQELVVLRERIAVVETNTGSQEIQKLRARMGIVQDFIAWLKGAGWAIVAGLTLLSAAIGGLIEHAFVLKSSIKP